MPRSLTLDVLSVDELVPAVTAHFGGPRQWCDGEPPASPGVYVWATPTQQVLYVGSGSGAWHLRRRLRDEQRWIDGHEPEIHWVSTTVVHMLKRLGANVRWIPTADADDAKTLERRLIEWHRTCVGIAPVIVGWEAKAGSPRGLAETWARVLWNQEHGELS